MHISRSASAWVVAITIVITAIAVTTGALNAFEPVKLAVVLIGGTAGLVTLWMAGGLGREALASRRLPLIAIAVFLGIMTLAALTSPTPLAALVGSRSRWGGLALYTGCAALFVAASSLSRDHVRRALSAVGVAGAAVAALGLLQWSGVPFLDGIGDQTGDPSTFGNINFAAGFVGTSVGAMAWQVMDDQLSPARRYVGGVLLALGLAYVVLNTSFQGIPTAGAAIVIVLAGVLWQRDGAWRRIGVPALGAVSVVSAAVVVLGALRIGPLQSLGNQVGVRLRGYYWEAAINMIAGNPLLGVAPDGYVYAYRANRTFDAAQDLELLLDNDAAHNIFLHFGTSGGLLLMAAFIAIVVTVLILAVRGLRRTDNDFLLIAGAGAAVTAYVVQGLVSIDVPGLAMLGWTSMGLLVAASGAVIPLKGKSKKARQQRAALAANQGRIISGQHLLASGIAVVVVAGLAIQPIRAETAALDALRAETSQGSVVGADQAADLGFWEPRYRENADLALMVVDSDAGFEDARMLFEEQRLTGSAAIRTAQLAAQLGDVERAVEWYEIALEVDPKHPQLRLEAAEFFADAGQPDRAMDVALALLDDDPDHAGARSLVDQLGS